MCRVFKEGRGKIEGSWQGRGIHHGIPEGRAGILRQTDRAQLQRF